MLNMNHLVRSFLSDSGEKPLRKRRMAGYKENVELYCNYESPRQIERALASNHHRRVLGVSLW
jgi:hypothetical protein